MQNISYIIVEIPVLVSFTTPATDDGRSSLLFITLPSCQLIPIISMPVTESLYTTISLYFLSNKLSGLWFCFNKGFVMLSLVYCSLNFY